MLWLIAQLNESSGWKENATSAVSKFGFGEILGCFLSIYLVVIDSQELISLLRETIFLISQAISMGYWAIFSLLPTHTRHLASIYIFVRQSRTVINTSMRCYLYQSQFVILLIRSQWPFQPETLTSDIRVPEIRPSLYHWPRGKFTSIQLNLNPGTGPNPVHLWMNHTSTHVISDVDQNQSKPRVRNISRPIH